MIYLDFNATTPFHPTVKQAIMDSLDCWGNPSSSHNLGQAAKQVIDTARQQISTLINAKASEIVFTSGGTESNHLALHSAFKHGQKTLSTKPHFITSSIEHPAIIRPMKHMELDGRIELTIVDMELGRGAPSIQNITRAIRPNTTLVSIMLVNNETGCIADVANITKAVKLVNPAILVHTDAAQAIGKLSLESISVSNLGVDYMTIVGHKFYSPRIGALYCRLGAPLYPMLFGGKQENNFRSGTENTCQIAGLGAGAEWIFNNNQELVTHQSNLIEYLHTQLKLHRVKINGDKDVRASNVLNVSFSKPASGIGDALEQRNIIVGRGAACSAGASSVLQAMGISDSSLRISVGYSSTLQDIHALLLALNEIL
jgi:selenocysteine lyase